MLNTGRIVDVLAEEPHCVMDPLCLPEPHASWQLSGDSPRAALSEKCIRWCCRRRFGRVELVRVRFLARCWKRCALGLSWPRQQRGLSFPLCKMARTGVPPWGLVSFEGARALEDLTAVRGPQENTVYGSASHRHRSQHLQLLMHALSLTSCFFLSFFQQ